MDPERFARTHIRGYVVVRPRASANAAGSKTAYLQGSQPALELYLLRAVWFIVRVTTMSPNPPQGHDLRVFTPVLRLR